MAHRVGMEASIAIGEAVKLADVDVVAAYPITPQTHIVEHISSLVAEGELDAEYICVESEHSAMSACMGAAAAGARTFTATAGQGLELMHEMLYITSAMRLPVVMTVAARALSGPLNVWGDHSDVMAARDTGWIQVFVGNGQETFDLTLWAFRVAEDRRVLLPVMVILDGFNVSHVVEPIEILEPEDMKGFLPPFQPLYRLHPDKPVTMGAFAGPELYTETRKAQEMVLRGAEGPILETWEELARLTGRRYSPIEEYRTEGAKTLLLTAGTIGETASLAVDRLRERGEKVGLLKLRLWRPFPFDELRRTTSQAETVIVVDRCLSTGGPGGPMFSEVKSALYDAEPRPRWLAS